MEIISAYKHSIKRDAIYESIRTVTSHPSAENIYNTLKPSIPSLSLGTVYRNISILRKAGLIISIGVVDGEERFEANTDPHSHFVCTSCCSVIDVGNEDNTDEVHTLELKYKVNIFRRELTYYGVCENCSDTILNSGYPPG